MIRVRIKLTLSGEAQSGLGLSCALGIEFFSVHEALWVSQ